MLSWKPFNQLVIRLWRQTVRVVRNAFWRSVIGGRGGRPADSRVYDPQMEVQVALYQQSSVDSKVGVRNVFNGETRFITYPVAYWHLHCDATKFT